MRLFIDDERYMPEGYDVLARTSEQAITALKKTQTDGRMNFTLVSFDYDAHSYQNITFMDVAEWMRDNNVWPSEEIRIHTLNYWEGRPKLKAFFEKYAPKGVKIDAYDPWTDEAPTDPNAPSWVLPFLEAQRR
jgi:hypothetical protein